MDSQEKTDIGSVRIQNEVLAEIVVTNVDRIKGVSLIRKNLFEIIKSGFGKKVVPGVKIKFSRSGEVDLEVKVCVDYGFNIPDVAHEVQEALKSDFEKTASIDLKNINVNIQGVNRRVK